MHQDFYKYLPKAAHSGISALLKTDCLEIKVKKERKTKHGDYKSLRIGRHQITINANLNPYRFLITLIHEIAHFEAYQTYGFGIKPHGKEWKQTFKYLMLPFLKPDIFPDSLLPLLAKHFINPKATSDTDVQLALALKRFDTGKPKTFVFEVPLGNEFSIYNGKTFQRGMKRRKRIECREITTGKLYLFNPNVEVELCV